MSVQLLIQAAYFVVAVVFILGLKAMSSPVTARRGTVWAGYAMVGATLVTFAWPGMQNFGLMIAAIAIGGAAAWISGKKVAMTDMPQMVAIYNGIQLWNEFIFAYVLTSSAATRTLPLALWDYQGEYSSNIPAMLAVVTLTSLPLIVAYAFGQERIVKGMMAGSLKA